MPGRIQSIERAAAILRLLSGRSRRLGVAELAGELGLPKGTVHGILRTLQCVGFVEQDRDSGKYQLGAALLHMGSSYLDGNELRTRALNWADALATQSGESVRIGTLHENQVLIVHHVFRPDDSRQALEVGSLVPGPRDRARQGAAGRPPLPRRRDPRATGCQASRPRPSPTSTGCAASSTTIVRARVGRRGRRAVPRHGVDRGADRGPPAGDRRGDGDRRADRAAVRERAASGRAGGVRDGQRPRRVARAGRDSVVGMRRRAQTPPSGRYVRRDRPGNGFVEMPRVRRPRADRVGRAEGAPPATSRGRAGSSTIRRRSCATCSRSSRGARQGRADAGGPVRARDRQPARDDRPVGSPAPARRCTTRSTGRTPAPTSCAASCRATAGRSGSARRPGCRSPPTSPGPRSAGCSTSVPGLRERAEAGEVLFGTIDSWLIWNLCGRARHRRDQRQPDDADEPAHAASGTTSC